jgi:hypothetical protein
MVYCPKCGLNNEDETLYCKSCGASLLRRSRRIYRNEREMCFGIPMQGNVLGLFFGLMIVLWGITELLGLNFDLWAIALIGFGVILIINVLRRPALF